MAVHPIRFVRIDASKPGCGEDRGNLTVGQSERRHAAGSAGGFRLTLERGHSQIEMSMQAGSVARLAFGDADDQATRALDRRPGAATLVIRRHHHRVDATRRHLFHRTRRNVVRLEILALVGLQLVEPGDAGFHLLGSERFCSHGGSPNSRVV
jgi:hypothetical protein